MGQDDLLKKEMTTHSSILARIIPRTEEPGGLQSRESQESIHNLVAKPLPPPLMFKPLNMLCKTPD